MVWPYCRWKQGVEVVHMISKQLDITYYPKCSLMYVPYIRECPSLAVTCLYIVSVCILL